MSLELLRERLPGYARDLRLNLANVLQGGALTPAQAYGTALAVAAASRNEALLRAVGAEAAAHLPAPAQEAALAAASLMAMNNVYYRATHLLEDPAYRELPARLRMQGLAKPGAEPLDFELWCLAVSAVNGCGACLQAHERSIRAKGGSQAAVADALRIAAVFAAAAVTLELSFEPLPS